MRRLPAALLLLWPVLAGLAPGGPARAATGADAAAAAAQLALGRQVFTGGATPACALCHTLRDAGAEGAVGPVLDELKPDAARVAKAVRLGLGNMPPFAEQLSAAQIAAVAAYVAAVAGR